MTDIRHALEKAGRLLSLASSSPRLDAEILLAYVLKVKRTFLYTYPERQLTLEEENLFQKLIQQRQQGFPIAYLRGEREFWSLPLKVSSDTLIPRPETELMVELALELSGKLPLAKVLDLGTGTGAIALALASEKPRWEFYAADVSPNALEVAKENAADLQLKNIVFVQSDWFKNIKQQPFDLIVSNPPYIAENDPHLTAEDIRFEPKTALISGKDGLDAIRQIITQSPVFLAKGGRLLLEHGYNQSETIVRLLKQAGFTQVLSFQDAQGHNRVTSGQLIS